MTAAWPEWLNRKFEDALAEYDQRRPDYWQNVARAVGNGKSAEDVKRHFQELERDLVDIEAGGRSRQNGSSGNSRGGSSTEEQRICRNYAGNKAWRSLTRRRYLNVQ